MITNFTLSFVFFGLGLGLLWTITVYLTLAETHRDELQFQISLLRCSALLPSPPRGRGGRVWEPHWSHVQGTRMSSVCAHHQASFICHRNTSQIIPHDI